LPELDGDRNEVRQLLDPHTSHRCDVADRSSHHRAAAARAAESRPVTHPAARLVVREDQGTLATEWTSATRGLGSLRVEDASADITMYVVASRGTSVHRSTSSDDSQDIVIYVSDQVLGARTVENNVAVALHELGHIWCCHGPDATSPGPWLPS